jgi:4-hydroxybenzoate polyprenyltransferase
MTADMNKLKDYLELVRFPGVFTAHADIVAGFLITGAGVSHLPVLGLLLASTSLFFFAGMALNDYFDYEIDSAERPARPLPSGRITRQMALTIGWGCIGGALFLSFIAGRASFIIALFLSGAIFAYDGGMKKIPWVGPLTMGACRYLNFLLGLSGYPLAASSATLPLLTGVYIFGVTVLSGSETTGKDPRAVIVSALSFAFFFVIYSLLFHAGVLPRAAGLYSALVAVLAILTLVFRLLFRQTPRDFQLTMKWLLISLILLDGIIVAGVRPYYETLFVWFLIGPVVYISKKFYMT